MANLNHASLFATYASAIATHNGEEFLTGPNKDLLSLHRDGALEVCYAPFDYIQPDAKLVILGITPGRVQAENALSSARAVLRQGRSEEEAARIAKSYASFSGPLRKNLVSMLDHIGLNTYLNVRSCEEVFHADSNKVHFTSALRYPVFVDGKNYNGQFDLLKTPALRQMVNQFLAAEAEALPNAIWLPLGPKPSAAVNHLVSRGALRRDQVLDGLPHPSGANNERIAYFLQRSAASDLSNKTRPERIDQARRTLVDRVNQLLGVK